MPEVGLALFVEGTVVLEVGLVHLRIAEYACAVIAFLLGFSRIRHPFANFAGTFPGGCFNHFIVGKGEKFDMDVNHVEKGAGYFASVALDLGR